MGSTARSVSWVGSVLLAALSALHLIGPWVRHGQPGMRLDLPIRWLGRVTRGRDAVYLTKVG
jgi:hypothetical protein